MTDKKTSSEIKKKERKGFFNKFPGQFWLVVMFEFFERGAYYGMMSFISVYFTDVLSFPKENVGVIKGVIQPLLYFLPIISGALADRFGYRRVLMAAFTLLGGGYFLTSQMTTYTAVFAALVIMGVGAGLFKPLISGTIAKMTDESNSTQAFGIYYWSINMGAFLFPLILVPFLKSLNPTYVIIASAICTAAMIVPTLFLFKEPGREEKIREREQKGFIQTIRDLIHTLAHAFEIIYSPVVLIHQQMKRSGVRKVVIGLLLAALLVYSVWSFLDRPPAAGQFPTIGIQEGGATLIFKVERDMLKESPYKLESAGGAGQTLFLTIYKPRYLEQFSGQLLKELRQFPDFRSVNGADLQDFIRRSDEKIQLTFAWQETGSDSAFKIEKVGDLHFQVRLDRSLNYPEYSEQLLAELHETPLLRGLTPGDCQELYDKLNGRAFFLLFVVSLLLIGLAIVAVSLKNKRSQSAAPTTAETAGFRLPVILAPAAIIALWFLPGVGTLAKIICSVIYLSVTSLFIIEKEDAPKFVDHFKFLLMIFLYSGFWVLYFQMFDSVLWYVQAYVDAASLNNAINSFLGFFGIHINWFFDVEHVTVINAGTIILLQLVISAIVKKKKALPTMITGIAIATVGMAILAISTSIWVFLLGIGLFSVGEMTAHPKFISYVGLTAPAEKKAMYMGYLFLYGVFGSSIGGIMGAKLYVYFVDTLNQPHTLWLVFASIGVVTIISLLLYNKFLAPKKGY
jgi:dipeptide/tripeptide permease